MCEQNYTGIGNNMDLWVDLLSEYQVLRGDTIDAVEQLRLDREINVLQSHLQIVESCVNVLEFKWSETCATALNRLGYNFNPPTHIPNEYRNHLQMVINLSKTRFVELRQLIAQLDTAKKKPVKTPTREYYEDTLINIEQFQRVNYSLETLTVYKFTMLEKKLAAYVLKQQNQKNGRANNR